MSLKKLKPIIVNYLKQFNPVRIGVFGSYARGDFNQQSDLDILIHFADQISLLDLVRIERELSQLTGVKIDLVTEGAVSNQRLKEYIYKDYEAIYQ